MDQNLEMGYDYDKSSSYHSEQLRQIEKWDKKQTKLNKQDGLQKGIEDSPDNSNSNENDNTNELNANKKHKTNEGPVT